jgi:2-polyprenyl-3-methyl-5-hydroxy-6-metoxy-1,4-benzoquinol methylase
MELMQEFNRVKKEYGDWTAHAIRLPNGIYTIDPYNENHFLFLNRTVQIAKDALGGSLRNKRVLDLACLEGGFAIEFALAGAEVVAVEGRKRNLVKLEFARDALQLSNIQTVLSDVRRITKEEYGLFDCVLCLGILYHLDKDSIGDFLKNIYQMTSHVAIIDTHISLNGDEQAKIDGVEYFGGTYIEHSETDSPEEIESRNWSSLNNRNSFFLTFASLMNLLKKIGFSSIYTCEVPYYNIMNDRRTIVAIKGEPHRLISFDRNFTLSDAYPEKSPDGAIITAVNAPRAASTPDMPSNQPIRMRTIIGLLIKWIRQLFGR